MPRVLRDFRRAPVDITPQETLYLDLTPDEDAILATMHPKWRYNIRLAARQGVTIREDNSPAAINALYGVMQEAAGRGEFFLEPMPFFAALHEHFVEPGKARVLLAEYEGQVLGAMLLVTYGRRATYLYGGTSHEERQRMAGYALQWGAMQKARAAGCTTYDFFGYEPYGVPDHMFAGFSRFKRGFGGQPRRFIGAHEQMLLDELADAIVRFVNGLGERSPA
jgi:peptidoglycan pentaglycine glycine transferase (the first glycine)